MSVSSPPVPSQGSSSRWISSSGTGRTATTPGRFCDRRGGGGGLGLAPGGIGLDDLDGDAAANLVVEPGGGAGEAHAGGGGEHGQEHHDRDHPGHRPGEPPLGQQAALGPAELADAALHVVGPLRRMAQRAGRIGDLAAVEPQHLGALDAREQMEIVGGDDDGGAELVQGVEQMEQPVRHFRIDVAGRLVGDEQFGPADHRPGDGDALLLAARQGRRAGAGAVGEADPGEHLADRRFEVAVLDPGDPERQRDIVEGGKMRDQPEILEDDADPPAKARQARARHGDDVLAEQPDQAAARPQREIEQFEQ